MDFMRSSLLAMAQRKGLESFPERLATVVKMEIILIREKTALEDIVVVPDGEAIRHAFQGAMALATNNPEVTDALEVVVARGTYDEPYFRDSRGRPHFWTIEAAMQPGSHYNVPARVAGYAQPLVSRVTAEYADDAAGDMVVGSKEALLQQAAAGQQAVMEAAAAAGITWDPEAIEAASSKYWELVELALAPVTQCVDAFTAALLRPQAEARRRLTQVLQQAVEAGRAAAETTIAAQGNGVVLRAADELARHMAPRALQLLRGDRALVQAVGDVFHDVCMPVIQRAQLAICEALELLSYWRPMAAPGSDWQVYGEQARLLATIEVQVLGALLREGVCSLHWGWTGDATCDTEVLVDWL